MKFCSQKFLTLASVALLCASSPILAQTIWIDATGDWFTATNWMAGAPPNTAPPNSMTYALIGNGGTAQIMAAGAKAQNLDLGFSASSSGTVSITGVGSLVVGSDLRIGNSGTGTFNISSGGTATVDTSLIDGPISGSQATVDGAGSIWNNTSFLVVGQGGHGALHVTNGGVVTSFSGDIGDASSGVGVATVDGAGSKWTMNAMGTLWVGYTGNGTLHITNGGLVSDNFGRIAGDSIITGPASPVGLVTVDGAGSTWTNTADLEVGVIGPGTLSITNGGKVSDTFAIVGYLQGSNGSSVTVNGAGSTWTNSNFIILGYFGSSTLD